MQALSRCLIGLGSRAFFGTKKEHVLTLSRQLLNNYRTFRPWKNIRLIHQLTMSRYDPEVAAIEKTAAWREDQAKIHEIINELSGQLHLVPHAEVNMLLNILKERRYRYSSQLPIFRALNKAAKMLLGKQFKAQLLPKTMFYIKALKFPKLTTIKMLQEFQEILSEVAKKEDVHFISLTNLLRLVIISLEEPYIPFPIVKKLLQYALKESVNTLSSRCALYHIQVILPSALNAKVQYQVTRANARSILFNPYSTSEEPGDVEIQSQDQSQEQRQYRGQVKSQLSEMASQINKLFFDSLDIKKLEQMIIEGIKSDIEPFTKQSIIYVSDILELRPQIEHYLCQNLETLTPVELIYLAKRCKDIAPQQIKVYLEKLGPQMSLEETAYLLTEANKHFHYPVRAQIILNLIQNLPAIDYPRFMAIAKLTELISKDQQGKIKEILVGVQAKMEAKGQESSDKTNE